MTIHEKIERLTQLSNRSAVSKAAGLGSSSLTTMLYRKSDVAASSAASLARVLGVDPGWLIDDTREWPPVRVEARMPTAIQSTAA